MSLRPTHVCTHLAATPDTDYHLWFTGVGTTCWWVCAACAGARPDAPPLVECSAALYQRCEEDAWWDGLVGHPEVLSRETTLRFEHREIAIETADWRGVQPKRGADPAWWVLDAAGRLRVLDAAGAFSQSIQLHDLAFPLDAETDLLVSPCERFAAVVQVSGQHGTVHALPSGARTARLDRGDYRPENSCFPIAFFTHAERLLLIVATDWNRLDVIDPATAERLTERALGEDRLDYFHAGLTVSPDGRWIADAGWVWHPVGVVWLWRLDRWLADPHEAETGASRRSLGGRDYFWDGPMCWIDAHTLAVWGWGRDDEWLLPAVQLVDVEAPESEGPPRWFAGPQVRQPSAWPPKKRAPSLVFDGWLFAIEDEVGVGVWDVDAGEHLHQDATIAPIQYHRDAGVFLSMAPSGIVLSRLVGAG